MGERRIPSSDIEFILQTSAENLRWLKDRRVFITGATGFFGKWLGEALLAADAAYGLDLRLGVLTRDRRRLSPHLRARQNDGTIQIVEGDLSSPLDAPPGGPYDLVLHLATDASASLNAEDPMKMFRTITVGMENVITWTLAWKAERLLFTSSGAVYGKQPTTVENQPEDRFWGPDPLDTRGAYAEGKRVAEHLCAVYAQTHGLQAQIARCFAFVGPHLPLDTHFAVGNFIRDALAGKPIEILGDGRTVRSYLYAAELICQLLRILSHGTPGRAYNVGSDVGMPLAEVADVVAAAAERVTGRRPDVRIHRKPNPDVAPDVYVPSIERGRRELGFGVNIPLDLAVEKTLRWNAHGN